MWTRITFYLTYLVSEMESHNWIYYRWRASRFHRGWDQIITRFLLFRGRIPRTTPWSRWGLFCPSATSWHRLGAAALNTLLHGTASICVQLLDPFDYVRSVSVFFLNLTPKVWGFEGAMEMRCRNGRAESCGYTRKIVAWLSLFLASCRSGTCSW